LNSVLVNISKQITNDPDTVLNLFEKAAKLTGFYGNMSGDYFELIVGHLVHSLHGGEILIGEMAEDPINGKKTDIDVLHKKSYLTVAYECKAYPQTKEVEDSEVDYWFREQIPVIRKWIKNNNPFDSGEQRFEFWTTSKFSNQATKLLVELKQKTKKFQIEYKDGLQVCDLLKKSQKKKLSDKLKRYYKIGKYIN